MVDSGLDSSNLDPSRSTLVLFCGGDDDDQDEHQNNDYDNNKDIVDDHDNARESNSDATLDYDVIFKIQAF